MKDYYDIVIIGGGPAGLAAAVSARDSGARDILILERDCELGGILNQCIHSGFGLHTFHEELTGPEYAARFIRQVSERNIEYRLNTTVMHIQTDKTVTAVSPSDGLFDVHAKSVILAMGCRERPRGALNIPGYRPAGIFSAGTAQRLINIEGWLPGKEAVIVGSGDIGLIMARRMTLEGAKVRAVVELMPFSGGLRRNIVQCLDDFGIPLMLSHTVIDIKGRERVEGVTVAEVDQSGKPVPGTEKYFPCDTLLLSVGLIPENELSREIGASINPSTAGPIVNESLETSIPGVFACGNVLHVHDLVDFVSQEAAAAGKHAALYAAGQSGNLLYRASSDSPLSDKSHRGPSTGLEPSEDACTSCIALSPGEKIRYTVPSAVRPARIESVLTVRLRVTAVCRNCALCVHFDNRKIMHKKKKIMTPGEMETLSIPKELFRQYPKTKCITIHAEEAGE